MMEKTFSRTGMGFIGSGYHVNTKEAEKLAYADALKKSKVISINNLTIFKKWKNLYS